MKKLMWLFAFCFLVSGCTMNEVMDTAKGTLQKAQGRFDYLIGSWRYENESYGPTVLTFNKDGTYELEFTGDDTKDIWGEYRTSLERIILVDVGGDFDPPCGEDGVYKFKVNSRELRFDLVADRCEPRMSALHSVWKRVRK